MFKVILCLLALTNSAHSDTAIGFAELTLQDPTRPLHVAVWYPTDSTATPKPVGENGVFFGLPVVKGAAPTDTPHPLVVMSHGYGGSWRNLGWVAQALVTQGYVVAAPDHPGTTTFDRSAGQAAHLWQRPRDLSRTIDALVADPATAGPIDAHRIAAVGHSLGGWTVAELGGARSDVARLTTDCTTAAELRACALLGELGVNPANATALGADLSDPRIRAVVSLDLGLARGFTPDSLRGVKIPVLVYGAGVDIGGLPAMLESGALVAGLPAATTHYVEIPDAMHFTFMQLCKPGAVEIIAAEDPGEEFVCQDPGPRDRTAIHAQVTDGIAAFLTAAFARQ